MVTWNVAKSNFSDIEQTEILDFESRLYNYIRGRINDVTEYRCLKLKYELSVCEVANGKSYEIKHNASMDIGGSYALVADIQEFFLKNHLPKTRKPHSIVLNLEISAKKAEKADIPQFLPRNPKYGFEQIILPDDVKNEIMESLSVIKHQKLIYEDWGFIEIDGTPRSVINLYGPPGTGKTMVAHAMAKELGMPLLALNYSEIESKYVGDAAKNLMAAFETAKKLNTVLFFDEADSFLGKRIENVTQGSDQALNSLRSQMLILLEEFSGTVIFATNLVTNFDTAFESRILKHIKFSLPNKEARAEIIRKMIPSKLPLSSQLTETDFLEISETIEGLSGREIKNGILGMLLKKAYEEGENAVFSKEDLKIALENKKKSIDELKNAENERLKNKILKKLKEKATEAQLEAEAEIQNK